MDDNGHICSYMNATRPFLCLKPCVTTATQTATFPPLMDAEKPYLGRHIRSALEVDFQGWTYPPKNWGRWVEKMQANHHTTWNQAHIRDAVLSSLSHIPRDEKLVLHLANYWCPSTNTFVFRWGEATLTLEDVWVLGGYSVLGDPVSLPLTPESQEMVDVMLDFQIQMSEKPSRKTEQIRWMNFFLKQETEHELEHVAFLSMWLSRFVFPFKDPATAINRDVFAIAVHLSQGKRLALAPAFLAGVYHFLTLLKEIAFLPMIHTSITVDETIAGAFEFVHHWAYERFPLISPPPAENLPTDKPRAAKWHSRKLAHNFNTIKEALKLGPEIMEWRPYIFPVGTWVPVFGAMQSRIYDSNGSDAEMTFGMCLCACELEGVAGVPNQKYMPHRVAKQLGYDQHFPGHFANMKPDNIDQLNFVVPALWAQPTVSVEYRTWWTDSLLEYIQRFYEAM